VLDPPRFKTPKAGIKGEGRCAMGRVREHESGCDRWQVRAVRDIDLAVPRSLEYETMTGEFSLVTSEATFKRLRWSQQQPDTGMNGLVGNLLVVSQSQ
jgi:hypothetical protein